MIVSHMCAKRSALTQPDFPTGGSSLTATPPPDGRALPPGTVLRILATSDLHMHLLGWDYAEDAPAAGSGLAGLVQHIRALRADASASLLLDNGDFLQGTLLGDWHAAHWSDGTAGPHPMVAAMNALGYDAGTLGNHEFDFGLDYLSAVCAEANYPLVAANLTLEDSGGQDAPPVLPWTLLLRSLPDATGRPQPIQIGLYGILPPQTALWSRRNLMGRASVPEIVASAETATDALRRAGADIVIALSHSGIADTDDVMASENASLGLAAIPGTDAIIAGHSHLVFPGPDHADVPGADCDAGHLAGVPAVMPGCMGSHLGQIDLILDHSPKRGWKVIGHETRLHRPATVGVPDDRTGIADLPDPAIFAHHKAREWGAAVLGQTTTALHSYFAPVHSGAATDLMARAQVWGLQQSISDQAFCGLPVLSAVAPFRCGGLAGPNGYVDIVPGPLSRAAMATLFPFPNRLRALVVNGAAVRDWLDHAVALLAHVPPGSGEKALLGPNWVAHNFDIIHGLKYEIDLAIPPRPGGMATPSRIRNMTHDGHPVTEDALFLLITNDYRANGGGDYPGGTPDAVVAAPEMTAQAALEGFLMANGPFRATGTASVFRFASVEAACARYSTGPGAARYLDGLDGVMLDRLNGNEDGFDLYCLGLN